MTGTVVHNRHHRHELTRLMPIGDIKSFEHAQTLLHNWNELYLSGPSYRITQVEQNPLGSVILHTVDALGVTDKYDMHDYCDYQQSIYLYGYQLPKIVSMFEDERCSRKNPSTITA